MTAPLRIPGERAFAQSPLLDACLCSAARILSRYTSRPLERFLAGHGITITEFQLMVVLKENPARTVPLARRLRLDARPVGRALAKLEERGIVRRAFRSRFSEWILEPEGVMHLELLEFGWVDVNRALYRLLGSVLSEVLVRGVDGLRYPVPEKHPGWSPD